VNSPRNPHLIPLGMRVRLVYGDEPAGRPRRDVGFVSAPRRGKSGLHWARWWVTPTRGDPRDSATESRPPGALRRDR
jgi:hypothetical protein